MLVRLLSGTVPKNVYVLCPHRKLWHFGVYWTLLKTITENLLSILIWRCHCYIMGSLLFSYRLGSLHCGYKGCFCFDLFLFSLCLPWMMNHIVLSMVGLCQSNMLQILSDWQIQNWEKMTVQDKQRPLRLSTIEIFLKQTVLLVGIF